MASALAVTAQVDEVFKEWSKPDAPGASVAVIRNGEIIFQKGYGSANLEYGIAVKPETVFHVASVSKQFTAMALVLLEQDGKLSLDDDIRKHLPELPDYGQPVTIRHLLQHTGGIRDQWQTLAVAGWRLDDVITQKQILRVLFRQKELNFPPGKEHLYSNGGYTLAAEIVARASGKPFPEFCEERIFKPLAMTRTHFHDDHKRVVRDRAYSYSRSGSGWEAAPLNYANAGATSLFTTSPDLVRWLDNFREPKVGKRAGVDRLQEKAVLADGKKIEYALGVSVGKYRGLTTVSHGGGDAGYRTYVVWFPEHQLGVAVLGNAGNFNSGGLANQVAAVYLGDRMEPETKKPPETRQYVSFDAATLDRYAGAYRLAAGMVEVELRDGKLTGAPLGRPKSEFKPLAANRFFIESQGAEVEFTPKTSGGMAVKITQGGGSMEGERVKLEPFNSADLPQYAGSYWSEELEARYTVVAREGKLFAEHIRHGEVPLTPLARDQFTGGQWFMSQVQFARDSSGRVIALTLGGGRIRGIRFTKQ